MHTLATLFLTLTTVPLILTQLIACFLFFFFNDTATTEIYTLSLHDALPISFSVINTGDVTLTGTASAASPFAVAGGSPYSVSPGQTQTDRKSTRLNSSHSQISYAVFCLKKKKKIDCLELISIQVCTR